MDVDISGLLKLLRRMDESRAARIERDKARRGYDDSRTPYNGAWPLDVAAPVRTMPLEPALGLARENIRRCREHAEWAKRNPDAQRALMLRLRGTHIGPGGTYDGINAAKREMAKRAGRGSYADRVHDAQREQVHKESTAIGSALMQAERGAGYSRRKLTLQRTH